MSAIRIELLASETCPHAVATASLIRAVLADEGLDVPVEIVPVRTLDEARALDFHGSPSIRVGGREILPPPRDAPITLTCRQSSSADASAGSLPDAAAIREAVAAAILARHAADIVSRLREVPARSMRAGFVWASHQPRIEHLVRAMPVSRGLVRRFIAGDDLAAAVTALRALRARGLLTTVDVLGEAVTTPEGAEAAAGRYLETLDALAAEGLDGNVSLKLTQMGLGIDRALCERNVARIAGHAAELGAFVRIDMEDSPRTDVTLEIARSMFDRSGNVGVVIQSYLRRSRDDVERLCREGIRVRLCKGAYNEPASVAYPTKAEVDESYLQLAETLLIEGSYPAFATHDELLIGRIRDVAARHDIGPDRYEFQMLFGIRRDLQERLLAEGCRVRVYVPYGAEWYPYFMRRLAERPANVLFLVRNLVRDPS
jgi:proline dehydrogenase